MLVLEGAASKVRLERYDMKTMLGSLVLVSLLAACGGKGDGPATSSSATSPATKSVAPKPNIVKTISDIADKLCACKDVTCADAAFKELTDAAARGDAAYAAPTPEELKKVESESTRAGECLGKLKMAAPASSGSAGPVPKECDELFKAMDDCIKSKPAAKKAMEEAKKKMAEVISSVPAVAQAQACVEAAKSVKDNPVCK